MFEVGKLPDENMENFVSELEKVTHSLAAKTNF